MNTNDNQKSANSSYGTLLSLFGRKVKPKANSAAQLEKAEQAAPQVTPCAFAQGRRVLIADDDVDSHELIDDLIEVNFRDVEIEHAVTKKSFFNKIGSASQPINLILFNLGLDGSGEEGNIELLKNRHPDLLNRTVFIVTGDRPVPEALNGMNLISRPFSLDYFGEVVQKVCAC